MWPPKTKLLRTREQKASNARERRIANGCTYAAYKQKGIIYAIKTFFNVSIIESVRWLYNHSSWFNKFLRKRARKQHPFQEIILDALLTNKHVDIDKIFNTHNTIIIDNRMDRGGSV